MWLPFGWIFLGIFGGIRPFGLVGLLLGPAIIAALVALSDLAAPTHLYVVVFPDACNCNARGLV